MNNINELMKGICTSRQKVVQKCSFEMLVNMMIPYDGLRTQVIEYHKNNQSCNTGTILDAKKRLEYQKMEGIII